MTLAELETAFRDARALTVVILSTAKAKGWRVQVRVPAGSPLHHLEAGKADSLRMFDGATIEEALEEFAGVLRGNTWTAPASAGVFD